MTSSVPLLFVFGCLAPGMLIAWLAGFVVRRFAPKWGLVDQPGKRKVHQTPTPMGGGLAIWLGVMTAFAAGQFVLWAAATESGQASFGFVGEMLPDFARPHLSGAWQQTPKLWGLLAAGTAMMFLGLADDRLGLHWSIRLGVQFGVAAACVFFQGWRLTAFISSPWLTGALSVVWIVAFVNSFNMLDNMDGLSGGVAVIAASLFATMLLTAPIEAGGQPQLFVGGFLLVLVGAIFGFLWHNRAPAKLFMGDAGSYFIGFSLAAATLLGTFTTFDSDRPYSVFAPLCVMAAPMYDMISVLWIRIREGRSPFEGDKSHFSHRLVDLGMSKSNAVWTVYLTTAACGFGALLLYQASLAGAMIILLQIVCLLAIIAILESTARRHIRR